MRSSVLLGFAPNVEMCSKCHKRNDLNFFFSLHDGEIACSNCRDRTLKEYMETRNSVNAEEEIRFASQVFYISDDVRKAVLYIINCPADKIYGFTMTDNEMLALEKLCEEHLIYRLEKKPKTLEFFNEVSAL